MPAFYRVHWLPNEFSENDVEKFFTENARVLRVVSVKKERSYFNEQHISNICKVKVEFNVDDFQKVCDFAGLQDVDGLSALFQLCGMPPKCLYCKEFGHVRKECKKSKLKCTKCNKTGHEAKEYNLAKILQK